MLALSVRQPWAGLIVAGVKPLENRTWATRHRGPLLIHAGQKIDRARLERMQALSVALDEMPLGGIIGRVELVGCVRDSESPWAIIGQWQWQLANPEPLSFEPMRGRLGLFHVSPSSQLVLTEV